MSVSFRFNYYLAFRFGKNKNDGRRRSAALSVTLLSVGFSGDIGKMSLRRHTEVDATSFRRPMPITIFHSFFLLSPFLFLLIIILTARLRVSEIVVTILVRCMSVLPSEFVRTITCTIMH